jgi:U3 small nucleolar RNA-associated protein 10
MTSVLAQQLKAISVGRPDKLKKGKASLLYDPQEAADVDVETIYNLALGGFDELCELDGRFQAFSKTLFGRAGLDVNRDLEGKETNDKFDASIKSFLRLLTGNFLLPCAFRALEYLVRRYKYGTALSHIRFVWSCMCEFIFQPYSFAIYSLPSVLPVKVV